jgi:hypothetical protein
LLIYWYAKREINKKCIVELLWMEKVYYRYIQIINRSPNIPTIDVPIAAPFTRPADT